MKIEYIRGSENVTDGLTVVTANRRGAAFLKAAMTLLYVEMAKANGELPGALLEGQARMIVEEMTALGYGPEIFRDLVYKLEHDGKAWYSFVDPKYVELTPKPAPYHPDPVINAEVEADAAAAREFDARAGLEDPLK